MMKREFVRLTERFGREMTVYSAQHPEGVTVTAFFQPERGRGTVQTAPSPLGRVKRDRFIYIGPAAVPLDSDGACRVAVDGEVFRVRAAQPVYGGKELLYWWAELCRTEGEVL